jgi:hypothetical protein
LREIEQGRHLKEAFSKAEIDYNKNTYYVTRRSTCQKSIAIAELQEQSFTGSEKTAGKHRPQIICKNCLCGSKEYATIIFL